ncbi:hypothetical protein HY570_02170 [Candidatus Micrarchaeota archaeon]|nr:hypothetical protein [Candidatus Micrarchaeota archaeon]
MGKNLKGFIFTFDALLAVIIATIFLTYLLSFQMPRPTIPAKGQLAEDILTIYEKHSLSTQEIRSLFLTSNSCGSFALYDSSDKILDNTTICNCSQNTEVRKRSIVRTINNTFEGNLAEVKIC